MRFIGSLARKFRTVQEVWILPWWGDGRLAAVPLWAVDTLVLVAKLCSTCTMAAVRILIPPVMKSLHGETVLVNQLIFSPALQPDKAIRLLYRYFFN